MALSGSTVIEVRTGGADTNGGGFVTGASGTDWSQQNAAQYSVADGVTAGTTTITSATAAFGTDVVGNLIYVQGGTGSITAAWYQIISRTNATTIVVDRSTGLSVGTGATLKIGGALVSVGQAAAIATVTGMIVYIQYNASPYIITTASTNVTGGCVSPVNDGVYFAGYDSDRSLYSLSFQNRPTLQLNTGVANATIFVNLNGNYSVQSVILDGHSETASRGWNTSGEAFYVKAINCLSMALKQNVGTGRAIFCEAASNNLSALGNSAIDITECYFCISHDNTLGSGTGGFGSGGAQYCINCISYANSRSGFATVKMASNCVAYGNTEHGFYEGNQIVGIVINCIAENNGLFGFQVNTLTAWIFNSGSYNNTSGRSGGGGTFLADRNPITGSGTFFVDATNHDFRLNNTAGAGASCRAAGFPVKFPAPADLTTDFGDVGAAQHQDTGGSSGGGFTPLQGMVV